MDIRVRRVLRVPSEYVELEYLKSTGQQLNNTTTNASYIDTGYIPNKDTIGECDMSFDTLSTSGNEALFGFTSPRFGWGFANVSPTTKFYFGLADKNATHSVDRDTKRHKFKINSLENKAYVDDVASNIGATLSSFAQGTVYLFARHSSSATSANKPANATIYSFKVWEGSETDENLKMYLVPCKRKSDNALGMYDLIGKEFLENKGTKAFTGGPEIHTTDSIVIPEGNVAVLRKGTQKLWQRVPWEYEEVEYIESRGTQYIDTGVTANNSTEAELDYSIFSNSSVYIFGTRINTVQYFTISGSTTGGTNTNFVNGSSVNVNVGNRVKDAWNRLFQKVATNNGTVTWNATNKDTGVSRSGTYKATISITLTETIKLFSNSSEKENNGRIYACKLKQSDTLVRNFIPVKKKSNNEYGMYDLVTGTFFGNSGTGAFIGGEAK